MEFYSEITKKYIDIVSNNIGTPPEDFIKQKGFVLRNADILPGSIKKIKQSILLDIIKNRYLIEVLLGKDMELKDVVPSVYADLAFFVPGDVYSKELENIKTLDLDDSEAWAEYVAMLKPCLQEHERLVNFMIDFLGEIG